MCFRYSSRVGGADGVQLAPREHRLEQVRGVDGALGRARPDHRVQLVDEQDDAAVRIGDLLQHRLQALLELAPVLRARHQGPEVEADDAFVLQPLRHVAPRDSVGEALDDGGLADPRLADEHGVVLGPARQHLQRPPDLVVAPDDGVEPVLPRRLGEVVAIAFERLVLALRVLVGDALASPHRGQRLEDPRRRDPVRREQPGRLGPVALQGQRRQQVLGADVVVLQPLGLALGRLRRRAQPRGRGGLGTAVGPGLPFQPFTGSLEDPRRLDAEPSEHRRDDPVRLVDQGDEQMLGLDLWMSTPFRELLRGQHRLLRLLRVALEIHAPSFPSPSRRGADLVAKSGPASPAPMGRVVHASLLRPRRPSRAAPTPSRPRSRSRFPAKAPSGWSSRRSRHLAAECIALKS